MNAAVSRKLRLILAFSTALAFAAPPAHAADDTWATVETNVRDILCGIYHTFKSVVGPLAVLVFVVAGVSWIMSRDDPGKRKAAQNAMIAIIVGVLLLQIVEPVLLSIWSSVTGTTVTEVCTAAGGL